MNDLDTLKREYAEGSAFLKNFKVDTIFKEIKDIVKEFIPKEEYKYLEQCETYSLDMSNTSVCCVTFTFGKAWYSYKVRLNAINFTIVKQKGHANYESFKIIKTFELAKSIIK